MAKTSSFGYTAPASTITISVPKLDWTQFSSDNRKQKSGELILQNTTSPLDQPETIRWAIENIGNVYNGTDIPTTNRSITTRGVSLVIQVNDILRVSDESDPECCCGNGAFDLPISTHIVVRVPLNQYVTAEKAMEVLKRDLAAVYNGADSPDFLNQLLRGSLNPKEG